MLMKDLVLFGKTESIQIKIMLGSHQHNSTVKTPLSMDVFTSIQSIDTYTIGNVMIYQILFVN
jgi:hypothetical protein